MNIEKEFPAFEAYKGAKFHFQETGSWRIVTSIQECKSRDFSIPQLFSCAEEENCVDENMNGILEYSE